MKNILFLFAAASLILATGCEEPEPEKTAEPQIFDFQVPEEEIEAFSARIIITCSDESLLWYYGLALSSDIAEDPDFAENARQSLLEYVKIMGGSYSASVPAIGKKANYVEREAIQQVITLSAKKHEAGKTKVTKVISK